MKKIGEVTVPVYEFDSSEEHDRFNELGMFFGLKDGECEAIFFSLPENKNDGSSRTSKEIHEEMKKNIVYGNFDYTTTIAEKRCEFIVKILEEATQKKSLKKVIELKNAGLIA